MQGRRSFLILTVAVSLLLAACSFATRSPSDERGIEEAAPYGIPGRYRIWADALSEEEVANIREVLVARTLAAHRSRIAAGKPIREVAIAFSGGGADGAFGAGLLAGWTARGDRPVFDLVTGVSTGAILGLFAFLGPEYDDELKHFYTEYSTDELLETQFLAALGGGASLTDAAGLHRLIDRFIDDDIVARLAAEGARGRILLIGTTNLDAARPMMWNVSAIAGTGHPNAKALIRDLIRASSAIPAVFPPVVIPTVTPDGREVDEVHVDGGATEQVMLYSPQLPLREVDRTLGIRARRTLYIVVNNKLRKRYVPVELGVFSIASRAMNSLITGSGSGDLYKIFATAKRDGIGFNAVWIPSDFEPTPKETFDPVYMGELYELGYRYGLAGDKWRSHPPNFTD